MKNKKLTTKEFIKRARKIHGNKHSYKIVNYSTLYGKVKIICKKHGVFEQIAGNHINPLIKAGCPYCAHKKVFPGENDLASVAPDVAKLFNVKLNKCLPSEIFSKTNKKYWFNCDNGYKHVYQSSPNGKVIKGFKCPICSGEHLCKGFNDLETKYPKIAKEWDYTKNKLSPSDYRYGSAYKAWWVCKNCGESYQSPINIHIRGHKCPYCAGLKIKPGFNDLKTLYPEIAKQYSKYNDVPVNKISAKTHKKVEWICPNCNSKYFASVKHRTSKNGTECPFCKKQSKGEREIKKILDKYKISYKEQEWFDDLRSKNSNYPLKYDFTIYKNKKWIGTIEFNGQQHYKPVKVFGGQRAFDIQHLHDFQKEIYSLNHGVPILKIPYDSPEGTEFLVSRFLNNLHLTKINLDKIYVY